ncbi:MAG: serine/threonine protein kinase [Polyangiaceae bacterium]|nr:serine/threonine protein kinase [Polyangiaceae bacterium]
MPGQHLGRYELLLAVAQGGMGTVWAARIREGTDSGRIVAVKTMLPALSSDPRFERMFLAESRIAARIHHPNVCAVLDQGERGGVLYFVMEWIDGDSVLALLGGSSRAQGRALPYPVAVRIGIEAARGLHAAHELRDASGALIGVVHRDVSPHNILVTRDGRVKIADFGIAKAMAQTEGATTSTGQMRGKVHFMSPEQVIGDALDRRSDVFALGIVLYQLTTGVHPFAASHDLATMAKITRPEPVEPPGALSADYPPDLEAAVLRALAKAPDERFASMAELADALQAVEARLGASGAEVTSFLRAALKDRSAARAAQIQEALRAVESGQRPDAVTRPGPGGRPGRGGRAIVAGAALMAGGALLGAAALVWLRAGPRSAADPGPPRPAGTSAAADGPAPLDTIPPAVDPPGPPDPAPLPAPPASSSDAGASVIPASGAPSGSARRAKFRDPGF